MDQHDDKVFLKRFSRIIVGLVIATILIIIVSTFRSSSPGQSENPSRLAMAAERIAPVAGVRTSLPEPESGISSDLANPGAASVAEPLAQASEETSDGETVYVQTCQACHMAGAAGAPIPGSDLWAERAAKGPEALVANAINGIGVMPPKGGFTKSF